MNAIFTGRKRRGKTTLAFDMAIKSGGGVIVFDPKREFRNWPNTVSSVEETDELVRNGARIIIFQPEGDTEEAFRPLGIFIMQMHTAAMNNGWDKTGKCFVLLVDEAHQLQNSWRINDELKNLLSQCRPEILSIFQTFQSPTDVYRTTKVCNSDWFLFQTTHIADIKRISEFAGDDVARQVSQLGETRAYIHFCEDDSSSVVVTDSETWKRDLEYKEVDVPKKKITFDEDSWAEFLARLKKDLGIGRKPTEGSEDEPDNAEEDETEGFVIVPPRRKAS